MATFVNLATAATTADAIYLAVHAAMLAEGWVVHDAVTNSVNLRNVVYRGGERTVGAGDWCYLQIRTAADGNYGANAVPMQLTVWGDWDATTHVGMNNGGGVGSFTTNATTDPSIPCMRSDAASTLAIARVNGYAVVVMAYSPVRGDERWMYGGLLQRNLPAALGGITKLSAGVAAGADVLPISLPIAPYRGQKFQILNRGHNSASANASHVEQFVPADYDATNVYLKGGHIIDPTTTRFLWMLDEAGGTNTVIDSVAGVYPLATATGTPTVEAGKISRLGVLGNGRHFNKSQMSGPADAATVLRVRDAFDPAVTSARQFTMGFWIKTNDFSGFGNAGIRGILTLCDGSDVTDSPFWVSFDVNKALNIGNSTVGTFGYAGFFTGYENVWVKVTLTVQQGSIYVYRNDVYQGTHAFPARPVDLTTPTWWLGKGQLAGALQVNEPDMALDEVWFENRVWLVEDLGEEYNRAIAVTTLAYDADSIMGENVYPAVAITRTNTGTPGWTCFGASGNRTAAQGRYLVGMNGGSTYQDLAGNWIAGPGTSGELRNYFNTDAQTSVLTGRKPVGRYGVNYDEGGNFGNFIGYLHHMPLAVNQTFSNFTRWDIMTDIATGNKYWAVNGSLNGAYSACSPCIGPTTETDNGGASNVRYKMLVNFGVDNDTGAIGGVVETTVPAITNITPATIGTYLGTNDVVGFDVTDSGANLQRDSVFARFIHDFEVVYFDGSFGPRYTGTRVAITNGFRYSNIIRIGGWPSIPTFFVDAHDSAGNESA